MIIDKITTSMIGRIVMVLVVMQQVLNLQANFEILTHPIKQNPNPEKVGSLSIIEQEKSNVAYIDNIQEIFVSEDDLEKYGTIALKFVDQTSKKQYTTVVNLAAYGEARRTSKGRSFREKIEVIMSLNQNVIGFNYVRIYGKAGKQIDVEIVEPEKGVDHVFKVEAQKKQVVAEQSFFTKYKWPLIIGGVLLYLSVTANPQKMQGQAAQ